MTCWENSSTDPVLEFIRRRFPKSQNSDSNWLNGNCYYFALILKDRFSTKDPIIYYDVIHGHFLTQINNKLYDARGIAYKLSNKELDNISHTKLWAPIELDFDIVLVNWLYFDKYDSKQYSRICEDCLG